MWYANTLTVVLGSWFLVRYRPRLRLASFAMWRQLAHYGRNILGAHTVQLAFGYLDTLTVGRTLSPTFVGWYGAATRLAILPAQATTYVAGAARFRRSPGCATTSRGCAPRSSRPSGTSPCSAFPLFAILAVIPEPFVLRPRRAVAADRPGAGGDDALAAAVAVRAVHGAVQGDRPAGPRLPAGVAEFVSFAVYLSIIWALDWITLERVAAGLGLSAAIGLAFTVPGVCRATGSTPLQPALHAVRPAVGGALVSAVAMYAFSWTVLGDIEDHRTLFGVDLGPVVPVLLMALVAAVGVVVFALAVEVLDRGSLRRLRSEGSAIFGRSGATAGS